MAKDSDYGAFMEKFVLQPSSSAHELPLNSLTFAVKDVFDVEGYVTGFGNPDWLRTHPVATSTAPAVLAVLRRGATCVGKTVMDEMAYSTNGENIHYGTPRNPCVPDRVPGGSSSGSAVAVGAKLVDFALGTDTGGSVRVPASYCGILGFRPSHDAISTAGVIPLSQSFDTVGWFARDPAILNKVGQVLLGFQDVDPVRPTQIIVASDCFQLLTIPSDRVLQPFVKSVEKLYGGHLVKHEILGDYIQDKVPSLKPFLSEGNVGQEYNIPSLAALTHTTVLLQRYEFKNNHGEWVWTVKPDLGPWTSERVGKTLRTTDDNVDICHSVMKELRAALTALLGPGPPPKLQMDPTPMEAIRTRAYSLHSIAGVSGFCQVSIPLGLYDNLPVSISLLAKHGSDGFLLNLVETLYNALKEDVGIAENMRY
ncbi:Amidase 1 [Morella rubra]|uniref:Amidase 1 n=1 Tax=Morella rubra TaxID=262757 RepID=A0A6A1UT51_9ROSI|nr:Amidase 1 [Morella rubra]